MEVERIHGLSRAEFDAVHAILDTVGSTDPLDKEEEFPLIIRAQAGDKDAMQTLIRAYLRLILKIAAERGPSSVPLEDRLQDGIEGFIDAVKRYNDPEWKTPLLAYARWRILMYVQKEERSYREALLAEGAPPLDEAGEPLVLEETYFRRVLEEGDRPLLLRAVTAEGADAGTLAVCRAIFAGAVTPKEISAFTGLDPEEVTRCLGEIRLAVQKYWVPDAEQATAPPLPPSPYRSRRYEVIDAEVAKIKVGERLRKNLGFISQLAASMSEIGLLQPIGLDRECNLLWGYRRLEAAKMLGWRSIMAVVVEDE
jgi:DNA-directed RNA polymerase specialized sigma24 family protein